MISEYLKTCLHPHVTCECSLVLEQPMLESQFIDKKKYNLGKLFVDMNNHLFGGELQAPDKIRWGSIKGSTGRHNAVVKFLDKRKTKISEVVSTEIIISNKHHFTEDSIKQIMVHEMIHHYFTTVAKENENHGFGFKQWASKLGKMLNLEIPITDDFSTLDKESSMKDVGIVLWDLNGRNVITLTSKSNFDKKMAELEVNTLPSYSLPKGTKMTIGIGKTPLSLKLPLVRNFKKLKFYAVTDSDIQQIEWNASEEKYIDEL